MDRAKFCRDCKTVGGTFAMIISLESVRDGLVSLLFPVWFNNYVRWHGIPGKKINKKTSTPTGNYILQLIMLH